MNLLLVDDEFDVLNGILNAVNFDVIGVDTVYTSQDAGHAKELLSRCEVDVMVTDIEMPGESGLELMQWVRERRLEIVMLFCTVYADFNYAQKAVELHSFDYFLKPIYYPALQERIGAAVQEAQRLKSERNYRKFGQRWVQSCGEAARNFWNAAVRGTEAEAALLKSAERELLPYRKEDRFSLCFLALREEEELPAWKRYAFQNMAEEIFGEQKNVHLEAVFRRTDDVWCVVLSQQEGFSEQCIPELCRKMCGCVQCHLSAVLSCYYDCFISLDGIRQAASELLLFCEDDAAAKSGVHSKGEHSVRELSCILPQLGEWELLLSAGNGEELIRQIFRYFDELIAHSQVDKNVLKSLRLDITQMVHSVLKERGRNAGEIFSNVEYDRRYQRALSSSAGMKRYLSFLVATACSSLRRSAHAKSVTGQVQEYIGAHLGEEITCASMAKLVYLNADYLARLFKKEVGMSIGAYLHECRIQEAKKLLLQAELPINEVAQRVGYDNFSYFSYLFRKRTGVSPNEYRKNSLSAGEKWRGAE